MTAQSHLRLRQHEPFPAKKAGKLPPMLEQALGSWKTSLDTQYRGISANGKIEKGIYELEPDREPCWGMIEAAQRLLQQLTDDQRRQVTFALDAKEWRAWSNVHPFLMRHGLCLDDLTPKQRDSAMNLLRETLSEEGFETARGIMKINEHNRETSGRTEEYGEWFYWLSLMGTPSAEEPWGWQIDGHHLIINCLVIEGQIILAPVFMGAEPVTAQVGKYAGTQVLQKEEAAGLALVRSLTDVQRRSVVIEHSPPADVFVGAFTDNIELPYRGVRFADLSNDQQTLFRRLVEIYLRRTRPEHVAIKRKEVEAHLADTFFCWMGSYDDESPFYYRVHSAVLLIEFDHLSGLVFDNREPTRNHIHTIVRAPNGNDYGMAVLNRGANSRGR